MLKPTPLHRRRRGRRPTVTVLNQTELAAYFQVPEDAVREALVAAGWSFHEDGNGGIWAVPPPACELAPDPGAQPDRIR
jgi:hypothetical protein